MKNRRLRRSVFLLIFAFFFLLNSSLAQHFVKMTDRQWVELALDMMRKGIQQQDTTKINMVVAPQVWVEGKGVRTQVTLSRQLQTIFNSSYKRDNQLKKPYFPRADNPLHLSGFWDFDILDPKIRMDGDSAVVDCELILWGALADKRSNQAVGDSARGGSKRMKERFVFTSPPNIEQTPPEGDWHKWPSSSSGKSPTAGIRTWQLTGFENLLELLDGEVNLSPKGGEVR
ncbi:MAG: hypothetical protein WCE90_10520 [Candidatus Zixiibacteriota bacterium]